MLTGFQHEVLRKVNMNCVNGMLGETTVFKYSNIHAIISVVFFLQYMYFLYNIIML